MNQETSTSRPEAGPYKPTMSTSNEQEVTLSCDAQPQNRHLLELPRELIELILIEIAKRQYCSLHSLAITCHQMREICTEFMERNPITKFAKFRPAGLSDESDDGEDAWGLDDSGWNYDDPDYVPDDMDEINEMMERFDYGSEYDSEVDEFLHGPAAYDTDDGVDEFQSNGNHQAVAGGGAVTVSEFNFDDNVIEGW